LKVISPNVKESQTHFFQCPVIEDISLKVPKFIRTFTPDDENESNFQMSGVKKPNKWRAFKITGFLIQQTQSSFT